MGKSESQSGSDSRKFRRKDNYVNSKRPRSGSHSESRRKRQRRRSSSRQRNSKNDNHRDNRSEKKNLSLERNAKDSRDRIYKNPNQKLNQNCYSKSSKNRNDSRDHRYNVDKSDSANLNKNKDMNAKTQRRNCSRNRNYQQQKIKDDHDSRDTNNFKKQKQNNDSRRRRPNYNDSRSDRNKKQQQDRKKSNSRSRNNSKKYQYQQQDRKKSNSRSRNYNSKKQYQQQVDRQKSDSRGRKRSRNRNTNRSQNTVKLARSRSRSRSRIRKTQNQSKQSALPNQQASVYKQPNTQKSNLSLDQKSGIQTLDQKYDKDDGGRRQCPKQEIHCQDKSSSSHNQSKSESQNQIGLNPCLINKTTTTTAVVDPVSPITPGTSDLNEQSNQQTHNDSTNAATVTHNVNQNQIQNRPMIQKSQSAPKFQGPGEYIKFLKQQMAKKKADFAKSVLKERQQQIMNQNKLQKSSQSQQIQTQSSGSDTVTAPGPNTNSTTQDVNSISNAQSKQIQQSKQSETQTETEVKLTHSDQVTKENLDSKNQIKTQENLDQKIQRCESSSSSISSSKFSRVVTQDANGATNIISTKTTTTYLSLLPASSTKKLNVEDIQTTTVIENKSINNAAKTGTVTSESNSNSKDLDDKILIKKPKQKGNDQIQIRNDKSSTRKKKSEAKEPKKIQQTLKIVDNKVVVASDSTSEKKISDSDTSKKISDSSDQKNINESKCAKVVSIMDNKSSITAMSTVDTTESSKTTTKAKSEYQTQPNKSDTDIKKQKSKSSEIEQSNAKRQCTKKQVILETSNGNTENKNKLKFTTTVNESDSNTNNIVADNPENLNVITTKNIVLTAPSSKSTKCSKNVLFTPSIATKTSKQIIPNVDKVNSAKSSAAKTQTTTNTTGLKFKVISNVRHGKVNIVNLKSQLFESNKESEAQSSKSGEAQVIKSQNDNHNDSLSLSSQSTSKNAKILMILNEFKQPATDEQFAKLEPLAHKAFDLLKYRNDDDPSSSSTKKKSESEMDLMVTNDVRFVTHRLQYKHKNQNHVLEYRFSITNIIEEELLYRCITYFFEKRKRNQDSSNTVLSMVEVIDHADNAEESDVSKSLDQILKSKKNNLRLRSKQKAIDNSELSDSSIRVMNQIQYQKAQQTIYRCHFHVNVYDNDPELTSMLSDSTDPKDIEAEQQTKQFIENVWLKQVILPVINMTFKQELRSASQQDYKNFYTVVFRSSGYCSKQKKYKWSFHLICPTIHIDKKMHRYIRSKLVSSSIQHVRQKVVPKIKAYLQRFRKILSTSRSDTTLQQKSVTVLDSVTVSTAAAASSSRSNNNAAASESNPSKRQVDKSNPNQKINPTILTLRRLLHQLENTNFAENFYSQNFSQKQVPFTETSWSDSESDSETTIMLPYGIFNNDGSQREFGTKFIMDEDPDIDQVKTFPYTLPLWQWIREGSVRIYNNNQKFHGLWHCQLQNNQNDPEVSESANCYYHDQQYDISSFQALTDQSSVNKLLCLGNIDTPTVTKFSGYNNTESEPGPGKKSMSSSSNSSKLNFNLEPEKGIGLRLKRKNISSSGEPGPNASESSPANKKAKTYNNSKKPNSKSPNAQKFQQKDDVKEQVQNPNFIAVNSTDLAKQLNTDPIDSQSSQLIDINEKQKKAKPKNQSFEPLDRTSNVATRNGNDGNQQQVSKIQDSDSTVTALAVADSESNDTKKNLKSQDSLIQDSDIDLILDDVTFFMERIRMNLPGPNNNINDSNSESNSTVQNSNTIKIVVDFVLELNSSKNFGHMAARLMAIVTRSRVISKVSETDINSNSTNLKLNSKSSSTSDSTDSNSTKSNSKNRVEESILKCSIWEHHAVFKEQESLKDYLNQVWQRNLKPEVQDLEDIFEIGSYFMGLQLLAWTLIMIVSQTAAQKKPKSFKLQFRKIDIKTYRTVTTSWDSNSSNTKDASDESPHRVTVQKSVLEPLLRSWQQAKVQESQAGTKLQTESDSSNKCQQIDICQYQPLIQLCSTAFDSIKNTLNLSTRPSNGKSHMNQKSQISLLNGQDDCHRFNTLSINTVTNSNTASSSDSNIIDSLSIDLNSQPTLSLHKLMETISEILKRTGSKQQTTNEVRQAEIDTK